MFILQSSVAYDDVVIIILLRLSCVKTQRLLQKESFVQVARVSSLGKSR